MFRQEPAESHVPMAYSGNNTMSQGHRCLKGHGV